MEKIIYVPYVMHLFSFLCISVYLFLLKNINYFHAKYAEVIPCDLKRHR